MTSDQHAAAGHDQPAALPVPTRRGWCISLDFLELPAARSGHDFLQVHIKLLTGRVRLVPTFKTATSETAARNFVASGFRDLGLTMAGVRTMAGSAASSPVRSLTARSVQILARGCVHAPDVSAARHGGLAARLSLLWFPVGAALSGARRQRRGRVSGPPTPTLTFSLVGGSSQFGSARSGPTGAQAVP